MKSLIAKFAIITLLIFSSSSILQAGPRTDQTDKTSMQDKKASPRSDANSGDVLPGAASATDSVASDSLVNADLLDSSAAASDSSLVQEQHQGFHKSLKTKFIEGNAGFMSLVALALVIGLAFCIERIIYLSLSEINATFIPAATIVGLISPAVWIWSKAMTIPITVPKNPNEGAMAMNKVIHEQPFSRLAAWTEP